MNYIDRLIKRINLEEEEKWETIINQIPPLQFDPSWKIKIIPPFNRAVSRFIVEKEDGHAVSVYLDWYGRLGAINHPCWEVYPHDGGVFRCDLKETGQLLQAIHDSK